MTDFPKLLDFIVQTSSTSSSIKWIMSSRNWPDIEERLERVGDKVRLSLGLNADSVSASVRSYIKHKVSRLAQDKKYDDQTKGAVLRYLYTNANDTFLWAALVCQNLNQMSRFNIVKKLEAFPITSQYSALLLHTPHRTWYVALSRTSSTRTCSFDATQLLKHFRHTGWPAVVSIS